MEYYHDFRTYDEFRKGCHDFYLNQGLWFLENDKFDEVIIWRLAPTKCNEDKIFMVNGKPFFQKFVSDFNECFLHPKPHTTFFRGGFPEYCKLTKRSPEFFRNSLYLGASNRKFPKYGGTYAKVLLEGDQDFKKGVSSHPFYKTASPYIFYPLNDSMSSQKEFDLVWPCNFTQLKHKGQKWFIQQIADSDYLKSLRILHIGNKPEVMKKMCAKYGVKNISWIGHIGRPEMNQLFNKAKFGIVTSNEIDGCPRISTEIMCAGLPLLIRKQTRLLPYYKRDGVYTFEDHELEMKIKLANAHYENLKIGALRNVDERLSMDAICELNLSIWDT